MVNYKESIKSTSDFLLQKGFGNAEIGVVLGTGLGNFPSKMKIENTLSYNDIPNFPESTVEFHKGQLICGSIGNKKIIVMQGRFHYYEGYSMQEITFPIRVLKELGVKYLLLSNAAGGIKKSYKKGNLVLIDDHINLQPDTPLRGLNDPAFGNRFVDMCEPYAPFLKQLFLSQAKSIGTNLQLGVYASVIGPNLETKAEYRYLDRIGADLVGMSTVPEVIVANHVGIQCACVSVITDECDPDHLQPVNIAEIIAVAGEADKVLSDLFEKVISNL